MKQNETLSIYIHWPFCAHICPYCDFNVYGAQGFDKAEQDIWGDVFCRELARAHALQANHNEVASIFFGGGTPSLMPPALIERLLDYIDSQWGIGARAEISLEANPESFVAGEKSRAHFEDLRALGVNRVSLGVQSVRDDNLRFLGRRHSARDGLVAFELAQAIFAHASLDVIYALPEQSVQDWRAELQDILVCAPAHLSAYQLSVEPKTAFYKAQAKGAWHLPDDDSAARLYETTQDLCARAGLPAYEVSNHARQGDGGNTENRCQHNVLIWRGGDYIGVGAGAAGRLTTKQGRLATKAHLRPQDWLRADDFATRVILSEDERRAERLLLGLRLVEGVRLAEIFGEVGGENGGEIAEDKIKQLQDAGLLVVGDEADKRDKIAASLKGRLVLDKLCEVLL